MKPTAQLYTHPTARSSGQQWVNMAFCWPHFSTGFRLFVLTMAKVPQRPTADCPRAREWLAAKDWDDIPLKYRERVRELFLCNFQGRMPWDKEDSSDAIQG